MILCFFYYSNCITVTVIRSAKFVNSFAIFNVFYRKVLSILKTYRNFLFYFKFASDLHQIVLQMCSMLVKLARSYHSLAILRWLKHLITEKYELNSWRSDLSKSNCSLTKIPFRQRKQRNFHIVHMLITRPKLILILEIRLELN